LEYQVENLTRLLAVSTIPLSQAAEVLDVPVAILEAACPQIGVRIIQPKGRGRGRAARIVLGDVAKLKAVFEMRQPSMIPLLGGKPKH